MDDRTYLKYLIQYYFAFHYRYLSFFLLQLLIFLLYDEYDKLLMENQKLWLILKQSKVFAKLLWNV